MSSVASQITSVSFVCSSACSGADQRKHQSSASLAFVRGIHRWPVNSPNKGPVTRTNFHLMTSSWQWQSLNAPVSTFLHMGTHRVMTICCLLLIIFYFIDVTVIKCLKLFRYMLFLGSQPTTHTQTIFTQTQKSGRMGRFNITYDVLAQDITRSRTLRFGVKLPDHTNIWHASR